MPALSGGCIRLEALSKELGLTACVKFTGFVSEDEKVRLLQQMWLG